MLQATQAQSQTRQAQIVALSEQLNQAKQALQAKVTPPVTPRNALLPTRSAELAQAQILAKQSQQKISVLEKQLRSEKNSLAAAELQIKIGGVKLQQADQQLQLARNDTARNALPDMTTVQTDARTVRGGNEIKLFRPVATFLLEDHPHFAWMLAEPPPI